MTRDELLALAERVEELGGPDREVDLVAHNLVHRHPPRWGCTRSNEPSSLIPKYTASLDAALTLVPEGLKHWNAGGSPTRGFAGAGLFGACIDDVFYGEGPTPALALTAAALRAHTETCDD